MLASLAFPLLVSAQPFLYDIEAFAGREPAPDGIDAAEAGFTHTDCVNRDSAGNIYFCTNANGNIYQLTPEGKVFRIFGSGVAGFSSGGNRDFGNGGRALDAQGNPLDLDFDSQGNLYFVQTVPGQLRRISPDGIVTRVAGTSENGFSGDKGPALEAQLRSPLGIVIGPDGSIYLSDTGNVRIRKITPDGVIQTIAGGGEQIPTTEGVTASSARLVVPRGLDLDSEGNLYIADAGAFRVYKLTPDGTISNFAGIGDASGDPYLDGIPATEALVRTPIDVEVSPDGEVYIAAFGSFAVRKVTQDGRIVTVYRDPIQPDEPAPPVLTQPISLVLEPDGNLIVADETRDVILRVAPGGTATDLTAERYREGPMPATDAVLYFPNGVLLDPAGDPLIVDSFHRAVRRVNPDGTIETIVGNGQIGRVVAPSTTPKIPMGLLRDGAFDAEGNLYLTDYSNNQILRVTPAGRTAAIAGSGEYDFSGDGGPATAATFRAPRGITVSPNGDIYVSDSINQRIRRIHLGLIETIAGSGVQGFFGEGTAARAAAFNLPRGLAFDAEGNLYVADTFNHRIRKITPEGGISTFAGNGERGHSGDGGPATEASLNEPHRLTFDADGYLYIGDSYNHVIRMVTPAGVIHTIAGTPQRGGGFGDGGAALDAKLNLPKGVAVRPNGDVILSDNDNHRVRILRPRPRIADNGVVNAASFGPKLAPGSIASVFGTNLAGMAQSAGASPLPTELSFSSLKVADSAGARHAAGLYYASRTQTNFIVPAAAATGPATVTVRRDNGLEHQMGVEIAEAAPGLFPQALYLVVHADGARETRLVGEELDLGPEGDEVYLLLFGTGIRNAEAVAVTVGGIATPVLFAGEQGQFEGLDQVNVGPLSRELVGVGETVLQVNADGETANAFALRIR